MTAARINPLHIQICRDRKGGLCRLFAAYGKGKGHGDRACHIAEIIDGVGLHGNAAADYAYYKLANGKDKIEIVPAMPVDSFWFCSYKFRYISALLYIFLGMRKLLLLCVLLILVCYIYGCKPNLSPQGLLRYIEYLEN